MNKTLTIIFTFLLTAFCNMKVCSQVKAGEELSKIIQASFTHFPKLKEADNSIAIAQERVKLVELNRQPDLTGDASYSYVRPKIELPFNGQTFQFAPVNNVSAGLNGTYTLLDFGRLKTAIGQAKKELQLAEHNREFIQQQLSYQVAAIYCQLIYLKKAVAIQDTLLSTLQENRKMLESQVKNGTALQLDLLGIHSTIDAEENRKTELMSQLNKQNILLEYATGISSISGNEFPNGKINPSGKSDSTATNPELQLLKDRIEMARQDLSLTQLRNKPFVGLRASMGARNGYLPEISNLRFNYVGGLSFSVPLYNGGKLKQQVRIQERQVDQQALAAESFTKALSKDLLQTAEDIRAAEERLSRTEAQITLAKTASQLASSKLSNGVGTHLELTSANSNLQRALLNQLQLQYQACSARLEYGRLMGWRL